jgi:glycerol kinase
MLQPLKGSVAIAGAAINWLRDSLQIINEAKESGKEFDEI